MSWSTSVTPAQPLRWIRVGWPEAAQTERDQAPKKRKALIDLEGKRMMNVLSGFGENDIAALTNEERDQLLEALVADKDLMAAAQAGEALVSLWPLKDGLQLDNDVKYNENLRVRQTREFAQVLVRAFDVTLPDAEYVYEGAEDIPGRPQEVVDALILANDVIDDVADFSQDCDPGVFHQVIDRMGSSLDDSNKEDLDRVISDCDQLMRDKAGQAGGSQAGDLQADRPADSSSDPADLLAAKFAVSLYSYTRVRQCVAAFTADNIARLVAVLFLNEFHERWSLPRLFVKHENLMIPFMHSAESWSALSQAASVEWDRHRTDVLWDPAEAKRLAKEEDEAKSKAALAKKFEHVKDDPSKPPVEL